MAYTVIPAPGTSTGPCAISCAHADCAEHRRLAATPCAICGEALGYGRAWSKVLDGAAQDAVAHRDCMRR